MIQLEAVREEMIQKGEI